MKKIDEDELNKVSMKIILHAGDARNIVKHALDKIGDQDFTSANELMKEASENLKKAHEVQTNIIQRVAGGEEVPYSVLFSHAQDTLMTIMSEYNIASQLIKIFSKLENKEN